MCALHSASCHVYPDKNAQWFVRGSQSSCTSTHNAHHSTCSSTLKNHALNSAKHPAEARGAPYMKTSSGARQATPRMIGQSSVIERAFQQMRAAESKSPNSSIGNHGKYDVLVSSERLQGEHRYERLTPNTTFVPRGVRSTRLPEDCFVRRKNADTKVPFHDVAGYSQTPKWYSPGAASLGQRHADLLLVREYDSQNKLGAMRVSWMCTLANAPRLMLRKKEWSPDRWVFSLGDAFGSVVLTWPATKMSLGAADVFVMHLGLPAADLAQALEPMVIADVSLWEARTFEWMPEWLQVQRFGGCAGAICAFSSSRNAESLVRVAARHAFYNMPMPALQALARHMDPPCPIPPGHDIVQVVTKMVKHVLDGISEEDVTDILQQRVPAVCDSDFIDIAPEVEQLLLDDDRKSLAEAQERQEQVEKATQTFRQVVSARRREHHASAQAAAAKAPKRKGRGKGRAAAVEPDWIRLRWPVKAIPQDAEDMDEFTEAEAQRLMPPYAHVHRDHFNGRWRVNAGRGLGSFSRSWVKHGFLGSYKIVAAWAWRMFLERDGRPLSDCPFHKEELDLEAIV